MKIKKPNDFTGNLLKTKRIHSAQSGSDIQRRRQRGIQKNVLIGAAKVCPPCSMCGTGRGGLIDAGTLDDDTSSSISGAASVAGAKPVLRKVLRHSSCVLDTLLRSRPVRRRRRRAGSDGDCGNHDGAGVCMRQMRNCYSGTEDNPYPDVYRDKSEEYRQYATQGERMRCYSDSETVVKKEKEPSYRSQNNLIGPDPPTATDQISSQVATDEVLLGGLHNSHEEPEVLIPQHSSLAGGGGRSQHCPFFKRLSLREEPLCMMGAGGVAVNNAGMFERSPSLQQLGVFTDQPSSQHGPGGGFFAAPPPPPPPPHCLASSTCSSSDGRHYVHAEAHQTPLSFQPSSHSDLSHSQNNTISSSNNMFTGDDYAASYMDLMIHIPNLRL